MKYVVLNLWKTLLPFSNNSVITKVKASIKIKTPDTFIYISPHKPIKSNIIMLASDCINKFH